MGYRDQSWEGWIFVLFHGPFVKLYFLFACVFRFSLSQFNVETENVYSFARRPNTRMDIGMVTIVNWRQAFNDGGKEIES